MGSFLHTVDLLGLLLTTPTQIQAHLVAACYRVECDLVVTVHLVVAPPGHSLCIGVPCMVIVYYLCQVVILNFCLYFIFQGVAVEQGGMVFDRVQSSLLQISTSDIVILLQYNVVNKMLFVLIFIACVV